MTTIQGYIEAMEVGLVDSEEKAKILHLISDKASLMSELIDGIFELSKLDSPDYPLPLRHPTLQNSQGKLQPSITRCSKNRSFISFTIFLIVKSSSHSTRPGCIGRFPISCQTLSNTIRAVPLLN